MKEKIIDFSNGIFTYEQVRLRTEPEALYLRSEEGRTVKGSFIINSLDERRVKGVLYTELPGLRFQKTAFFGRASRIEYEYHPDDLMPGENCEAEILLVSNAGEYHIPVKAEYAIPEVREEEEIPLPKEEPSGQAVDQPCRMGGGRREEWKTKRELEKQTAELFQLLEQERRGAISEKRATEQYRALTGRLAALSPDLSFGPVLDAWVMLREDRREEAGWLLRKYEKTRFFQLRDSTVRAFFLYVKDLWKQNGEEEFPSLPQVQKLYQKQPDNWHLVLLLMKMDHRLMENTRMSYKLLERQFRAGARNRLIYQAGFELLKKDPALFSTLDPFALQIFAWASAHGFLTPEMALMAAGQAGSVRRWSLLSMKLLKACYQTVPCRETVGAVCAAYIRGQRTDQEAFVWYQKGVELDARITNLYEYFMYALPDDYNRLLPRQVILYFDYHNTLTGKQKTAFYCNLVRYGGLEDPETEKLGRKLQEYLLEQLKGRRINEQLAWLYGRCLLTDTLDQESLYALADLLLIRKLTCTDRRIRQVEVSYSQLKQVTTVPVSGGSALIPVYTPNARIVLLDEQGRRYEKTVSYDLKRLLIEPKFLQVCIQKLTGHTGLNLYRLDGNGSHRLSGENVETALALLSSGELSMDYERQLKLEYLQYERKHRRLETLSEAFFIKDAEKLSGEEQGAYIEILILLSRDREAWDLLRRVQCHTVEPRILMKLILRLKEEETADRVELLPWIRELFRKGICTEWTVSVLAEFCEGSIDDLLAVWKAAEQFELVFPHLEEQLLGQALFTESRIEEVFPVFQSMDDRGGDPVLISAFLNYVSWLDFVKEEPVPEGLFDSLETHLIWEDHLARVADLSYLKQLSALLLLTDSQKRLVKRLLGQPWLERRRFSFLSSLASYAEDPLSMKDYMTVEYRCNPEHRVVLHYVLEYHGKKNFDYMTEQLYPVCGGVFTRAFILFYGERLTWFFTEEKPDGTEVSTACRTFENREEHPEGVGRYERLCRMQKSLDYRQERPLKRMMREYDALSEMVAEQFRKR